MEKRRLMFEESEDLEHGLCPHCEVEMNSTALIHVGRGFHCRSCDAVFIQLEDGYLYEMK